MRIERFPTPNAVTGRDGHTPRGVVVHTNVGTFEGTVAWFARRSSGVSAHYLVGLDGRVASFVDEADTARHAGRKIRATAPLVEGVRNPNLVTIGIELEDGGDPHGVDRPDAQYEAAAELLRAVAERWAIPLDREHVVGHREINASKTCPGNVDVDRLLGLARAAGSAGPDAGASDRIVCLLPVRNGERDLPAYLKAAGDWCDAIVALDDGSDDGTRALLEAHPLVRALLTNPPRDSFAGWDDGANRARLLEAAADLRPGWILSVDVDERIPREDAAAMRAFLATDALPRVAYGFRHLRLWGEDRVDPEMTWVYRLFAFDPGHRFSRERLHFNPVPTAIPRGAWVRTTLRLLHLGSIDEERLDERARKYREADPAGEFDSDFGGLDRPPARVAPVPARDEDAPVLAPIEDQLGLRPLIAPGIDDEEDDAGAARPLLVVLLPVRNGEDDLPGWFDSVRPIADAVIAFDDGSTDGTRALLEAEPLVHTLLGRPPRPDDAEWDDAGNRKALLDAAAALRPRWILSLDADERLSPDDAKALRTFVETDARPGFAYGFPIHRMVGDLAHWDRAELIAYRLFAWERGQSFPAERLHFVPVPASIPRSRYVPTTVRVQHLAGLSPERRRERFEKYRLVDPEGEFQADYGRLLEAPEQIHLWEPRPADLPVVLDHPTDLEADEEAGLRLEELDLDAPVLSAVVIARDDQDVIERAVRAVVDQEVPEPFEVIVVTSGTDRTADVVRERFPDVILVELDRPALPGEARNAGLAVARGDYVSFPGSHVIIEPGSLAARIRAHQLGYPMVTGTTLNLTDTPAGWASYFLDHSAVLPGRPSEELDAPPAHCSYDRELLLEVGGFPEGMRAGEDTVANLRLAATGCRAYRAADVRLAHRSPCVDVPRLLVHHFRRGRGLGRILLESPPEGNPVLTWRTIRAQLIEYLPRRLSGVRDNVRRWADEKLARRYRSTRHLVAAGAVAALAGTWAEILRPAPGKLGRLVGPPAVNFAIAGLDRRDTHPVGRTDVLLLARVEPVARRVRVLSLPRDLRVDIVGGGSGRLNEAYFVGAVGGAAAAESDNGVRPLPASTRAEPRRGMRALERTLEGAIGIHLHGTVLVDFDGFRRLVDSVGGVEVDVPHPIDDEFVGEDGRLFSAHFSPGRRVLDGEEALTYARTRKADGDAWRRRRHVELTVSLARGVASVRSPRAALGALAALGATLRTDLGPLRTLMAAVGIGLAAPKGFSEVAIGPPVVRSVKDQRGKWMHVGDPREIADLVRRRWLLGEDGASAAETRASRALR